MSTKENSGKFSDSSSSTAASNSNAPSTGETSLEDILTQAAVLEPWKTEKQQTLSEHGIEETKTGVNDRTSFVIAPEGQKGPVGADTAEPDVGNNQADADQENLATKDFDDSALKTYILERIDEGVLKEEYMFDSPLGERVASPLKRMRKATKLLAYVENLKMRVTHLQHELKQQDVLQHPS